MLVCYGPQDTVVLDEFGAMVLINTSEATHEV